MPEGVSRVKSELIDHTENADFHYDSWKDVSGHIRGLENYKFAIVEAVAMLQCADQATTMSLNDLEQRLLDSCREACPKYLQLRTSKVVCLMHPNYEVKGVRVFATRSPGITTPVWMNNYFYMVCRFACPFLGTVYRLLFFRTMPTIRYKIIKRVTTKSGSSEVGGYDADAVWGQSEAVRRMACSHFI